METFKKPLTAAQEKEYLRQMNQGSSEARTLLIEHNMRLVAHIIKKYAFTDKETDDLLSIGTIGLIKAVNTLMFQGETDCRAMRQNVLTMRY